ncbi:hypothetical protein [Boseongicola sp. H5]|uniref:hypothetical protein n=1 Tax=Boseongicola sp. H5 TaxID=2763261 RepID=UPI001D0A20A7|nr:hypothetical protein [Boseongicola sp. H5]
MLQATFMFRPGQIDAEFDVLNAQISARAEQIDGFVGEESWRFPKGDLRLAVYYWSDREGLDRFVRDAVHVKAKGRQSQWYNGYHVIVSQIVSTYGDGKLPHVTGDWRRTRRAR